MFIAMATATPAMARKATPSQTMSRFLRRTFSLDATAG